MIKDLLVHLDGTADDALRLALAEMLADRYKAHLGGLFVNAMPGFGISADAAGTGAVVMADLVERAIAEGDRTEKRRSANGSERSLFHMTCKGSMPSPTRPVSRRPALPATRICSSDCARRKGNRVEPGSA